MSIHDPAPRLLIIGLDGGTWDVFGPLCDLGEMPNLARLREQGAWGLLQSTQPPFTAPAWTSFLTGVNPGRHGILGFWHKPADPAASLRHEGRPVHAADLALPTVWDYCQAAGRKVGMINVPLTYPLRPLDGFAIAGMLTPPGATDWTYPPELRDALEDYIIELEGPQLAAEPSELLATITHMTERRGFHTLRLMQSRPWDVLMVVFTGTDRLFHYFWHYLRPGADVRDLNLTVSAQLSAYFHLLDSIIGSLVRSAGRQAHVIVMSDHGFGPAARHWVHLNHWLLESGLLHLRGGSGSWLHRLRQKAPWLRHVARRLLPTGMLEVVRRQEHLADAIDWEHTLAWAEPLYNNVAGIYLHRADRFAQGAVSPAAVEGLRRRLMAAAHELTVPGTGARLVQDIRPREAVYNGPHVVAFPDLILTLDPDYAAVPTLGTGLITPIPRLIRTGDHRPEGLFLVWGPQVRPGLLTEAVHILDLPPTLLHLLNLPIPTAMEGRVVTTALQEGYLVLHPPRYGPTLPPPPPPHDLTPAETATLTAQLRGLGYL
jgi:predicted AlkP superfamily phosphohydrolase/phosphomutase